MKFWLCNLVAGYLWSMLSVNSLPAGGELILLTAVQLETSGELGDVRFTDVFLFSSSLKFFFLNSEQSLLKGGIIFVVSHTCVMQRSEVRSRLSLCTSQTQQHTCVSVWETLWRCCRKWCQWSDIKLKLLWNTGTCSSTQTLDENQTAVQVPDGREPAASESRSNRGPEMSLSVTSSQTESDIRSTLTGCCFSQSHL